MFTDILSFDNPTILIDKLGKIISLNQKFIDICGYKKEELIGQNIKILIPEPYKSTHDLNLKENLVNILCKGRDVFLETKNGEIKSIKIFVFVVCAGDSVNYIAILDNNITRTRECINERLSRLEMAACNLKERFECRQKQQ